jgi:diguanylate cyclase (GGDEF)-like protein/PAS domain S-box-containing protein
MLPPYHRLRTAMIASSVAPAQPLPLESMPDSGFVSLGQDELGQVLETIAQGLVVVDSTHHVRAFNRRFVEVLALSASDIFVGQPFCDVLEHWAVQTHQSVPILERAIWEIGRSENFVFEFSQKIRGEERWCQMFHNPHSNGGFVRTFTDITEKRKAAIALRHERELLATVMANMAQALVVVAPDGRVTDHNSAFRQIFPFEGWESMIGRPFSDLIVRWAKETGKSERSLRRALERLKLERPFTFEMAHSYGDLLQWTVVHHNPLPDGGFVRTFTDITERKRLESELRHVADTDWLTGLDNRRVFMQKLEDEIGRASRYRHPLALMMVDLDHFKQINDTYGHAAGDEALRVFSGLAQMRLRASDHVGRLGGEEFGIILPEADIAGAIRMGQRLLDTFAATPIHMQCRTDFFYCSFSAGIALCHPKDNPDTLLSRADHLLYQAKSSGRSRIEVEVPKG